MRVLTKKNLCAIINSVLREKSLLYQDFRGHGGTALYFLPSTCADTQAAPRLLAAMQFSGIWETG